MKNALFNHAMFHFVAPSLLGLASLSCAAGGPIDADSAEAEEVEVGAREQGLSAGCDPINTHCEAVSSQACELGEDVIEKVGKYVCILVPDPKWYNPASRAHPPVLQCWDSPVRLSPATRRSAAMR